MGTSRTDKQNLPADTDVTQILRLERVYVSMPWRGRSKRLDSLARLIAVYVLDAEGRSAFVPRLAYANYFPDEADLALDLSVGTWMPVCGSVICSAYDHIGAEQLVELEMAEHLGLPITFWTDLPVAPDDLERVRTWRREWHANDDIYHLGVDNEDLAIWLADGRWHLMREIEHARFLYDQYFGGLQRCAALDDWGELRLWCVDVRDGLDAKLDTIRFEIAQHRKRYNYAAAPIVYDAKPEWWILNVGDLQIGVDKTHREFLEALWNRNTEGD